jgi:hypothetical protein
MLFSRLLLLLGFCLQSALGATVGARQLLLIKTHNPTPAMLTRWCQHLSNSELAASYNFSVAIMFYSSMGDRGLGDGVISMPSPWCMPYTIVRKQNITEMWGEAQADEFISNSWVWCSAPDLTYFALHSTDFPYDSMWVFDQDVAWTGNVFELLTNLGRDRSEDLLCFDVNYGRVGKKYWWQLHNDKWMWHKTHSNWSGWDDSPGAPRIRCYIMVVRYSASLLHRLVDDYLSKGRYAHGEFFASTACGLQMEGCTVGDFASQTSLLGKPFSCCDPAVESVSDWLMLRSKYPSALFHRVKI